MSPQSEIFETSEPTNDKARYERARSIIKAETSLQSITNRRRAARRLERALGACVASGVFGQPEAVKILVEVMA